MTTTMNMAKHNLSDGLYYEPAASAGGYPGNYYEWRGGEGDGGVVGCHSHEWPMRTDADADGGGQKG